MAGFRVFATGVYVADEDAADELINSEEALTAALTIARTAAGYAREFNPSAGEAAQTVWGGPIEVPRTDGEGEPIRAAWFGSSSSIWHIIEFGSINNPPYRPLSAAAERVGLRLDPE